MDSPRVRIITFGCKVNQCDGETMEASLAASGYGIAGRGGPAEVYIVNTCAVTAMAEAKARKLIRRLAREHPAATLVVTGCWAQREPGAAALPGVAAVVPNTGKPKIAEAIGRLCAAGSGAGEPPRRLRTRAFVKLQDGCDHGCAYCAVPAARGRPESKPLGQALAELRDLAAAGAQEVVLCGVRLGGYGRDRREAGLAKLLRELRGAAIPRVRLSSLEPMDVGAELLEELRDHPWVCHHLHLPLQSGDDEVLAEMGRGYTAADYTELVRSVRRAWPEAAITTDVMVGFPGETEEQYERTVALVREIGFSRLHVFPYSSRPGTRAAGREDQVPAPVKRARLGNLLEVGRELARGAPEAWVGREVEVLFEQRARDGSLTGLTEHYLRVRCPGPEEWIGRIVRVQVGWHADGELRGAAAVI